MTLRLLLLSGDVEMNPGPLGQHNEGEMVQCVTLLVIMPRNGNEPQLSLLLLTRCKNLW